MESNRAFWAMRAMFLLKIVILAGLGWMTCASAMAAAPARNLVIFVADGLRYGSVDAQNAPNLYRLKREGVDFLNSHALFPTITTVNASAIATGHYIGDTGDFGNAIYTAVGMLSANGAPVAALENDMVLAEMNQRFAGNYLHEDTLIARARSMGFSTAVIGKLGPARIQDSTAPADGSQTLIVDDNSGYQAGFGVPSWYSRAMKQAFVAPSAPKASAPDIEQEVYLMKATTRIVLNHFAALGKPFVLLFWSRDPDFSQHNTKDSVGEYDPGINGPTGQAGVRDADTMFGTLMQGLKQQGLDKNTDVFVTADHGFTTVSHASVTSPSTHFGEEPVADLRNGFLAVDIASALQLPLFDPDRSNATVDYGSGALSAMGTGLIGPDSAHIEVAVMPNGGADLLYLNKAHGGRLAQAIVKFLATQDYVSGIFVDDALGRFPGALPMSALDLLGAARTPRPSIIVNFRTFTRPCPDMLQCTIGIGDTPFATGQGSHGSLSRAETRNFMAAIGPDFKAGYGDSIPVSNADIAPTLARLAGIGLDPKGKLVGRVIAEALKGGREPRVERLSIQSDPTSGGLRTILDYQQVGQQRYFDAAGFAGRTVGLGAP